MTQRSSNYWAKKLHVVPTAPLKPIVVPKDATRRGKTPKHIKKRLAQAPESRVLDIPPDNPDILSVGRVSYQVRCPNGTLTECTPLLAERMALLVASGISQMVAGAAMGLDLAVMRRWNTFGRRDIEAGVESPFSVWWNAMLMAKASCEANWVARLNEGTLVDWRAAAFMLERRFADRWALKTQKDTTPEASDVASKSTAELQALLELVMSGKALPENTETSPGEDA